MPVKGHMALYIGGMGARDKNFYNTICQRYGYVDEAIEVQDLYLDGKKQEAAAAIPLQMVAPEVPDSAAAFIDRFRGRGPEHPVR